MRLDRYFPYRLSVLSSRIARTFADQHIAHHDLSIPEWRVIMTLQHLGPVSPGEISTFASMDKAKVNRATTRLHASGFISRDADQHDGRRCTLALTESGRKLHDKILPIGLGLERELLSVLSAPERKQLAGMLDRLDQQIRKMGSDDVDQRSDEPF